MEGAASDIDVRQRPWAHRRPGGACCVHVRAPWWARAFAALAANKTAGR